MKTEKKMDMYQFAESIKERLEQQEQFEVGLKSVLKNNGVKRCGLTLRSGENNLASTIYIEPFFEAYKNGADMDEIIGKILETSGDIPGEEVDMSFFQNFSTVRDRLCMKLVNKERNAELLPDIPHRPFLDMAIVYYVVHYNPKIGSGTIQVHNSNMEMWGVTEEDLWEVASIITPLQRPGRIESMKNIMAELFAGHENCDSECCNSMAEIPARVSVITNTDRVYGAAAILYNKVLEQAADRADSDLFILPSSLHEVLAIPAIEEYDIACLKAMVMDINRNVLQTEDVLSDNVYIYRREQDRLEVV